MNRTNSIGLTMPFALGIVTIIGLLVGEGRGDEITKKPAVSPSVTSALLASVQNALNHFLISVKNSTAFIRLSDPPHPTHQVKEEIAIERVLSSEKKGADAIHKLGGWVTCSLDGSIPPNQFEARPVLAAYLRTDKADDAALEHVKAFTQLRYLVLDGSRVTDAGLQHLQGLSELRGLSLSDTKVTGAGIEYLKSLAELQELYLDGTQVTDIALCQLKSLPGLRKVGLCRTAITDAGLKHLKELTQLKHLFLRDTEVSNVGLEHLEGLSSLQELVVFHTEVTDEGVRRLHKSLPNCKIIR